MERDLTTSGIVRSQARAGFSRPAFYQGQVLAPGDLNAVVAYSREKLQMLLRYLIGPGIAGGLAVRQAAPAGARVIVEPGYAVDGYGQELYLREPAEVDLTPLVQAAARADAPLTYELRIRAAEGAGSRAQLGGAWTPDGGALAAIRTLEGVQLEAVPVRTDTSRTAGLAPAMQLIKLDDTPVSVEADGSVMVVTCESSVSEYDAARLTLKRKVTARAARTYTTRAVTANLSFDAGGRFLLAGATPLTDLPPLDDAVASPAGDRLFVALTESNVIGVIDAERLELVGVLPAGRKPGQLLVHPTAPWLLAVNRGSADVTVFHMITGKKLGSLRAPEEPASAAFDPYGRLWIPGRSDSSILVADPVRLLGSAPGSFDSIDFLPLAQIRLDPAQIEITDAQIDNDVRNGYRLITLADLSQAADPGAIGR